MKEKELYAWIRLIIIEAGYEEQKPYGKCHFVTWRPKYDFIHEDDIKRWIREVIERHYKPFKIFGRVIFRYLNITPEDIAEAYRQGYMDGHGQSVKKLKEIVEDLKKSRTC